ncbi:AF4/FMR2 family member 2 isoform X2 [Lepisosteus oculatus]|uniref:AF4/FMR2 family member 2 isoform X2 n=1 Tax=Lepisosteus oculatus TaxID=7918 RepID=UPI0007402A8C|nr:PREDICTED: AF4/FMR2 family member 2 isoform X2 [Lepisosteus oculatus]
MDLFEFDFFRDWELEQQCHYEQDRNALKKKEWERRTQEVQQDEDLFSSGFNLFGEPYKTEASSQSTLGGIYNPDQLLKTNKGDALANRVQNTLGNYDEMKDLLTNHSNQSHLVGIPKNSIPQTPVEKSEQSSFFSEGQRNRMAPSHQSATTSMPPPSSTSLSSSTLLHGHQGNKKSRSTEWSRGTHSSATGQPSQAGGQQCGRAKHNSSSHEPSQTRYEDLFSSQGDLHKGDSSPASSSSHSRRHVHSSKSSTVDQTYKESNHSKSPAEQDFGSHGVSSPLPSTSLIPSGLSTPNFPPVLHSKPSIIQQKPTAYVRPMDGQDQVPNDSPDLKTPAEIGDGYNNPSFGGMIDGKANATNAKSKLPKLTLPQPGEEMTHSWPPPLTAIHTPGKADQTKFPIPSKDSQHLTSGYNGQKRCNVPSNKPATKSVPQKSMLEDDLKLSSDEEDSEQTPEKAKPRSTPPNLPGSTARTAEPGHSSGASGSSSESESSSESDSDSESSSSDSECNEGSRSATPEPEPPSTNKWQLDKWLNKVNPHNKTLINTQPESHGLNSSQSDDSHQTEGQGSGKGKPSMSLVQPDPKERVLLSPIRDKAKPRTGQKTPEGKITKLKSPANIELAPPRRTTGKKQPKKVERPPSAEEYNWLKPNNPSSTPKEKEPPPLEQSKARNKAGNGKTAPRKEPRSNPAGPAQDKKKHRGATKIIPKSKEFIETESSSSECHSDPEELVKIPPPCPGPNNIGLLKSKDCNSNILSVSSLTSTSSASIDPSNGDLLEDHLFSPIPMVQNVAELLSPLRDFEEIKSLWVKIELSFLSRIPGQDPPESTPVKAEPRDSSNKHRRQSPASATAEKPSSKTKRKHKSENCDAVNGNKKLRLEKETLLLPPCISPIHNHKLTSTKDSLKKQPRKREEKLLPPPLSPLSDEPLHLRRNTESSSFIQEGSTSSTSTLPTHSTSATSNRHRKGENKMVTHSKTVSEEDAHSKPPSGLVGNGQSDPDLWSNLSSTSLDHLEPRRPKLTFDDTLQNADHYMQEAKKLKHKADALMEKFGKAVNYADGALSFIECGNAMERDPLEAKSPYTMYSETVELIRYAMRLKNFTGQSATVGEKKLAVLCYRCLSLLYLRMFKLKKDHAMKYSRSLMEYFKNSVKSSQAPSPWGANGKSTGTPSPMSLSPSPVGSVSSTTGTVGSSSTGSIAIPHRIHHMAASHVNITNNILRSYEHWDTAEKLSRESQEFFQELNSVMGPLTQHSTMTELVRYARQGLHWLRIESNLL